MTYAARSVVETACFAPYEAAVAICDEALRRDLVSRVQLERALAAFSGWPGTGAARAAVSFADGRSESVGESRLRVLMDNYGLPRPELQVRFGTGPDRVVARVDFYFPAYKVVVEFDGNVKYRDQAPDVVLEEKWREDRLREMGILVVRVSWDDLARPDRLVGRIRRAFEQATRAANPATAGLAG